MKKGVKITVGVLGVGLIFGLGIGGGYYLATKNNQSSNNPGINEPQKDNDHQSTISENIDINSALIKELCARNTNYHISRKITYDTLNDNQKVLTILNVTKQHIFNEDYKKTCQRLLTSGNDTLKKEYDTCIDMHNLDASGDETNPVLKYINTTDLKNNSVKLFGTDKNLPTSHHTSSYILQYIPKEDIYLIERDTSTMQAEPELVSTTILKATKTDDTLEIYDQYIYGTWKDQNTFTFYTDEEKTNSIGDYQLTDNDVATNNINSSILKQAKNYKHTYKLDKTTNNYYWVSSEPIEKTE
ncbi:MAG TPA: hypothetical protein DHU33_06230 [Firmicutes bacterium]|nr:hypothetical protein [Bacillota bacterium]